MSNDVLLVHSDYWPGVARLPSVLHAGGARVTVMAPRGSDVLVSKYNSESIAVPSGMNAIVEALRLHLLTRTYDLVILGDDPLLNALALRSRKESWIRDILPVPDERSLDMLATKIAFLDRCRESGLPIAQSINVSDCEAAERAAAEISYPVMLKLPTGHGGTGVKKIDTAAEMHLAFDIFARGHTVTVERFIVGNICGCEVLYDRGRPVCWSPFVIERSGTEFGASTVRTLFAHPKIQEIIERLGELTKFHGFGVLDFVHDEVTGELVLLELNFRPGPGTHLKGRVRQMFAAGFASMMQCERKAGETHGLHGRCVVLFPQEMHRAFTEKDPWSLIALMLQGRLFVDAPFDDPPLLARHLGAILRRFVPPLQKAARSIKRGLDRATRRRGLKSTFVFVEPVRLPPIELAPSSESVDVAREMVGV